MGKYKRIIADVVLLIIVLIWGTTFPLMKDALKEIKPLNFIFIRFSIATLVLGIAYWKRLKKLQPDLIRLGIYLGLALTGGFIFQVSGLQFTTASKAGFITGLSVVIVPIISIFYTKKLPSIPVLSGVGLAVGGLLFLSYDGNWTFTIGDLLILLCAISFGLHIFFVGQFVQKRDPILLTLVQIGVVSVFSGAAAGVSGQLQLFYSAKVWWAIVYMAVMATGLAFLIQNWAQQFTTSIRTAIIFSMEPVFAMIFAFLLLAEPITGQSLIGGGMIILGMILAEVGDYLQLVINNKGVTGDDQIS